MQKMTVVRLAALAGLVACADDATAPTGTTKDGVAAQVSLSTAVVQGSLDFSTDLENLRIAVLPTFADTAAASAIRAQLITLQDQLAAGDRTAAAATLAQVRDAIKPDATDVTTLGYVGMVFDNIDTALAPN